MATIQGTNGDVTTVTGWDFKIDDFTADLSCPSVNTTGFVDAGNSVSEPVGPIIVTGNVNGTAETGTATAVPFGPSTALGAAPAFTAYQGSMTLTFDSVATSTLTFVANITNVSTSRNHADKMTVSQTYESTGAITLVWA